MTLNFDQTQTWSNESKNSGNDLNNEFKRIYTNISKMAGDENPGQSLQSIQTILKHRGWGDKRQTCLQGSTDETGKADFLKQVDDAQNNITLTASIDEPVIFSVSSGNDEWGAVEYTVKIDEDVTPSQWTSLTTNGRYFLYLTVDQEDRSHVRCGISNYVPVYSRRAPVAPEIGQHWFDLNRFRMMEYTGDVSNPWQVVVRIFIGEIKIEETQVVQLITYAIRGEYEFDWLNVQTNKKYPFLWHNIGTTAITCDVYVKDNRDDAETVYSNEYNNGNEKEYAGENSNAEEYEYEDEERLRYCDYQYYYSSSGGYGMGAAKRIQRNRIIIGVGKRHAAYYSTSGDRFSTPTNGNGDYKVRVKRNF